MPRPPASGPASSTAIAHDAPKQSATRSASSNDRALGIASRGAEPASATSRSSSDAIRRAGPADPRDPRRSTSPGSARSSREPRRVTSRSRPGSSHPSGSASCRRDSDDERGVDRVVGPRDRAELVDDHVEVHHRVAVEDADHAIVAGDLLEAPGVRDAEQLRPLAEERRDLAHEEVHRVGHEELGERAHERHLVRGVVHLAGRRVHHGLGEEPVGDGRAQRRPRREGVGREPAGGGAARRELERHLDGVVGRPDRERRGERAGELQALQHRLEAVSGRTHEHLGVDDRAAHREPADVGTARAVRGDLGEWRERARLHATLVEEDQRQRPRSRLVGAAREHRHRPSARRVVDGPLLAVQHDAVPEGRGRRRVREVGAPAPLRQPPRDRTAVEHELGHGVGDRAARDPRADRTEEGHPVRHGDGEVAARDAPDHHHRARGGRGARRRAPRARTTAAAPARSRRRSRPPGTRGVHRGPPTGRWG